jgi:uncharacterized CHY-type Zn-finger protein
MLDRVSGLQIISRTNLRRGFVQRDLASSRITERSLWHRSCQHLIYDLTCADFERLLAEAQFACQRCHQPNERLGIDHDHRVSQSKVRGLLCPKCNRHLSFVDAGTKPMDTATTAYLANPFVRTATFEPRKRSA